MNFRSARLGRAHDGTAVGVVLTAESGAGKEDPYLADLRVHDLRHTVGMRLREANVRENTVADIVWHEHRSMTGHYSVAQIPELVAALEAIADENGRSNKTLQMLRLEAKKSLVA